MSKPYTILGQTFHQSPTLWLQVRNYTKGELLIYGTGVETDGASFFIDLPSLPTPLPNPPTLPWPAQPLMASKTARFNTMSRLGLSTLLSPDPLA